MWTFRLFNAVVVLALLGAGVAYAAADPSAAAPRAAVKGDVLVFSSPPRETAEVAKKLYDPIAAYLSKVLGKPVVYKYPRTFGVYRTEMLNGDYDILFDGAHFIGYRVQKQQHNALVKFPNESRSWAVFIRNGEKISTVSDLIGKIVCAQPTPTIGALVVLSQFDRDQSRQPFLVSVKVREDIYKNVLSGTCAAGVLPITELKALDPNGAASILYQSAPIADQGFSAGPRVSRDDQAKIAKALLAPEAAGPTEGIRTRFKGGPGLVAAKNDEYTPFAELLRNEWGFADQLTSR
jgi:ABC-type phosphate/phosphonate transport system substrate-binding protein